MDQSVIHTRLPPLHGSSMLKNYEKADDDEMRLGAFSDVVDLVLSADLRLYRGGYYVSPTLRKIPGNNETGEGLAYSMTWMGILRMLEPYLENNYIIPVMDGFDQKQIQRFSQILTFSGMSRAQGLGESLTIRNTHNILGEVFYADDQHSVLTQVVDICSYLRNISDRERTGKISSVFSKRLADISKRLEPIIVREEIVVVNLDGKLSGPMESFHFLENRELYE